MLLSPKSSLRAVEIGMGEKGSGKISAASLPGLVPASLEPIKDSNYSASLRSSGNLSSASSILDLIVAGRLKVSGSYYPLNSITLSSFYARAFFLASAFASCFLIFSSRALNLSSSSSLSTTLTGSGYFLSVTVIDCTIIELLLLLRGLSRSTCDEIF